MRCSLSSAARNYTDRGNHLTLGQVAMMPHFRVFYLFFILLVFSGASFADNKGRKWETAKTESELYQGLQGSYLHEGQAPDRPYTSHEVKIEGDWAAANMVAAAGAGSWLQVFRYQGNRWRAFAMAGGRGAPPTRQDLLKNGVPAAVVANFGFGPVPKSALDSLRKLGVQKGKASISVATYGTKLFGGLREKLPAGSKAYPKLDVYEYVGDQWVYIFTHQSGGRTRPGIYKDFRSHQLSEYMGSCISSGTAAHEKI